MTRSLLALCLLVLLASCITLASAAPRSRSHSQHRSSTGSPSASVDGWALTRSSAVWFSVCEGVPPPNAFEPNPSPIPVPEIDPITSAVQLTVVPGLNTACVAYGFHSDDVESVGWSYLSVETNAAYSDWLQSRAAGILEGYVCQERIYQMVQNIVPGFYPDGGVPSVGVATFLNDTIAWKLTLIQQIATLSPYWSQVGGLYLQVQGLLEGYMMALTDAEQVLSWFDIYSLQLDVDIGDITQHVGLYSDLATPAEKARAQRAAADKVSKFSAGESETHCSSLVKLLPGNSDLLVGHDTWSHYFTMLRTFKLYTMPLSPAANNVIHESSYPGFLFSSDDWYQLLPSMLTVTETSLDIYAPALYALIQPGSVGIWARTLVALRLATSGPSWVEVFSRYNSGTCDNQWIILDHKLFTAGETELQPNLLTISEQTPGAFFTHDMTASLQKNTYWSSFNIPAFAESYHVAGYDSCTGGAFVCGYYQNFRYLLFQQQQATVVDIESMKATTIYNEWQTNPIQRNSSGWAIAARRDLMPNPSAFGGIDAKTTSDSWMKQGNVRVLAYSGPTNAGQKPFCWGGQFAQPLGQPECFDFPWVEYSSAAPNASELATE